MEAYVFVYGSLRNGFSNHKYLNSSFFLGNFETCNKFQMVAYKLGAFPYVLNNLLERPSTTIKGEIYIVDYSTLKKLDMLEDHPTTYQRNVFNFINEQGEIVEAWMYVLIKPLIIDFIKSQIDENYFLVESGDWSKH
jgi:gamma-glutamylaminecyclotransferase